MNNNTNKLASILNTKSHPIHAPKYRSKCKSMLDRDGVLVLKNFLLKESIQSILEEAKQQEGLAYYCVNAVSYTHLTLPTIYSV